MKVPYAQATEAQIRAFAEISNIPHDGRTTENTLRVKIEQAMGGAPEEIDIPDAPPPTDLSAAAPTQILGEGDVPDKRRVKINIMPDSEDDSHVPVAVNGRLMLLPRGRDIIIPYPYYEALDHARMDVYQETGSNYIGTADQGPGLGVPRPQHSYPFSVLQFYE